MELTATLDAWKRVLMGYFMGLNLYTLMLASNLKKLWQLSGGFQVIPRGKGFYVFHFFDEKEME